MAAFKDLEKELSKNTTQTQEKVDPHLPEQRIASELIGKREDGQTVRPWKLLVEGFAGTGKSQLFLSVPEYEFEVLGTPPQNVMFELIDMDDGIIPLLEEGVCPYEYQKFIQYTLTANFNEWIAAYNRAKKNLIDHKKKTGHRGWLFVDNVGKVWEWARDKFCRDSYGVTMLELLELRRIQALEAGKRVLPVFDQLVDYAVINPLHNDIMEEIKVLSGKGWFNFIWSAPMKEYDGKYSLSGQWENPFRVDYEIRKYVEGEGTNLKYFADLIPGKHRSLKKSFVHLENPTLSRIIQAIEQLKKMERDERANDTKDRGSLLAKLSLKKDGSNEKAKPKEPKKPTKKATKKEPEEEVTFEDFESEDEAPKAVDVEDTIEEDTQKVPEEESLVEEQPEDGEDEFMTVDFDKPETETKEKKPEPEPEPEPTEENIESDDEGDDEEW